jgi:hypothetical protein
LISVWLGCEDLCFQNLGENGNKMRRTLEKYILFTREEFGDDLVLPFYGTFERYLFDPPKKCF